MCWVRRVHHWTEAQVRSYCERPLQRSAGHCNVQAPALSLRTHPRNRRAPFVSRQILCFLDKLRLSVKDLIKIREFCFASKDERECSREEKTAENRRLRKSKPNMPNFWVIGNSDRHRHECPITFHNASVPPNHMDKESSAATPSRPSNHSSDRRHECPITPSHR